MTVRDHTCDRKGPPAKVIDDPDGESITRIFPTCSVCGVPQMFREPQAGGRSFVTLVARRSRASS